MAFKRIIKRIEVTGKVVLGNLPGQPVASQNIIERRIAVVCQQEKPLRIRRIGAQLNMLQTFAWLQAHTLVPASLTGFNITKAFATS